jgi:hypothetical protein
MNLIDWLRQTCNDYKHEPIAVFRRLGEHGWPLHATDEADLERQLRDGGHFLPLPREPAALANVLEVALIDFLLLKLNALSGVVGRRGTERGYPDLEVYGGPFGDAFFAVEVKVARRAKSGRQTQSRITLYTGNTYFKHQSLKWPGMFRAFADYKQHIDVIVLYTLNPESLARAESIEVIVQEPWRIASKQRSSTTREYLGAVVSIDALRNGKGEFDSESDFYRFWRKYSFKTGKAVDQQLTKLIARSTNSAQNK